MSERWQTGDLALCVRSGPIKCPNPSPLFGSHLGDLPGVPAVGAVREVSHAERNVMSNGLRCGCLTLRFADGSSGVHLRFRKIEPHEPDEEDRETIALLKATTVIAGAA